MNERSQLWIILEAVFVCVVFASLYAMGGSGDFGGHKWVRRFLAPGLFSGWAFIRSGFDWRYIVQMGPMMGALCLPYGADDLGTKWLLRGAFGAGNGLASSVANFFNKRLLLAVFQTFLVIAASIMAGVYNPFQNAMVEMFCIGFIIIFIPALSVRPKKV